MPTRLLDREFLLDLEFLDALAQGGARDAEQFGCLDLISLGFQQRLDNQFPLDRRQDPQLSLLARPAEEGAPDRRPIQQVTPAHRRKGRIRRGRYGSWGRSRGCCQQTRNLRRQIAWQDDVALGHHGGALDDILQFTDIPGPAKALQHFRRGGQNGFGRFPLRFGKLL